MGILHRLFGSRARDVWRAEAKLLQRLGYVRPPEAVQWISTSACDLHCPHCYSHAGKKTHGELTTDEAKRLIIDGMVRLNRPVLVVAGGETLLRKEFPQVIAYAHSRGVPWAIHTHGGHVERHLDSFEKHPPVMAAISLDGPREYHDEFRGKVGRSTPRSGHEALKAPGSVKSSRGRRSTAATRTSWPTWPATCSRAGRLVGLPPMTPEGRAGEHPELLPTPRQLRRAASFGRRLAVFHVELDNEWGGPGPTTRSIVTPRSTAGPGGSRASSPRPARSCPARRPIRLRVGNVRDRRLSDIWAEGFALFRSGGSDIKADCDDCWLQTRHGRSCRPAFTMDLFEPDGRRLIPLLQVRAGEGVLS